MSMLWQSKPLGRHTNLRRRCHWESEKEAAWVVRRVVSILGHPRKDWDEEKLDRVVLKPSVLSSEHFLQITLQLSSIPKSLNFLKYLTAKAPHHHSLSSVFQASLQLASRHPNSQTHLLRLHRFRNSTLPTLPLTPKSASLLFHCLQNAQMLDDSLLLFNQLHPSAKSSQLCNGFLRVLLISGRSGDALHVLDEMPEPNSGFPATGEVVFGELVRRGTSFPDGDIVGLVTKLGERGVFPDAFKLTQLVSKLCGERKIGVAWEVLHSVMRLGGAVEAASCNALLTGLGRERDVKRMNELLAEMEERRIKPSVVTFGILVNHFCKAGRMDEALHVFDGMRGRGGSSRVGVEPDVVLFNTLIDGLCKAGREEDGLSLLEEMKTGSKNRPNSVTYNCLIDGFCKAGNIDRAQELFRCMKEEGLQPNVVTLNALVDGMCKHGRVHRAVEFFNEMKGKDMKGNAATYTALISAFCGVNNIDKAMKCFEDMLSSGCSPDAIVYYCLISGLSVAGRMNDASVVVSKLKQAGFRLDRACYNVLISGFCKRKKLERVYELLDEMEETGVKPDTVTYNTLISYLGKTGDFATAGKMMEMMIKEGLKPSVVTYGAVIHAYCLKKNVDEGMKIFRGMCSTSKVSPNTVIYNILIDALCKNDDVEKAVSLMEDMKVKGVRPNTTTYNAILKGVRDKKMLHKAFELMDRMVEDACRPDYTTMEILTEWLSTVGEIEKLKHFVEGCQVS
ncbi:pentatricopeptide repeat-containing protein At3g61520, mitochondrial [Cajanus cajan]|nr:pentatricopeptide repeat-containing protein At3g61520, mitochondrial [Cajanus cajan]